MNRISLVLAIVIACFFMANKSSAFELELQQVFNNLGYSIDVFTDEIYGDVFFQVQETEAWIIEQYSALENGSALGWYTDSDPDNWLIGGIYTGLPAHSFFPDISDVFGLTLWTNYSGLEHQDYQWFSERSLNGDAADHVHVYQNRMNGQLVPHSYILAWEDLPNLGDADFQDMVVRLDGVQAVKGSGAPVNPGIPEPATILLMGVGCAGLILFRCNSTG
jgi:hypothetical protein